MKPRLDAWPWTDEDKAVIAFRLTHAARHGFNFYDKLPTYLDADKRDAELMSWAQCEGRWIRTEYGVSHYGGPLGRWDIDLGGAHGGWRQ
jgi:hypothetical protein